VRTGIVLKPIAPQTDSGILPELDKLPGGADTSHHVKDLLLVASEPRDRRGIRSQAGQEVEGDLFGWARANRTRLALGLRSQPLEFIYNLPQDFRTKGRSFARWRTERVVAVGEPFE